MPNLGTVEVPKSCECKERTKSGSALATSSFTEMAAGDSCSASSIVGERRLLPAAPERSSFGESRPQAEKMCDLMFAGARSVLAGLHGTKRLFGEQEEGAGRGGAGRGGALAEVCKGRGTQRRKAP